MRIPSLLSILLLSAVPVSAAELSLLGGYRAGGPSVEVPVYFCIAAPCPQPTVDARDGEAFGLILDIPFRENLMFEILLSHQSGEFEDGDFPVIEIFPPAQRTAKFDLTYLHFGLLRQWQKPRVSPFAAVGVGIAQLEADRSLYFFDSLDEDRLSASLGGGVKFRLSDWFGIRLEGRGYWADMPANAGEDIFQLDFSTGLSFKL